jgi:putative chitinase
VKLITAEIMAPIFAATIDEGTFSKGEAELPDFLATILHESRMLRKLKEDGNYSAARIKELGMASAQGSRWRAIVPRAAFLEYNPEAFFEALYGGRMGNGPEGAGDGARYPGRAFIGITGKDNYAWLGERCGQDLLTLPELAEQPTFALEFTIAWWEGHIPDAILGDERKIRKVVQGGYFGIDDVERLARRVREVLS